VKGGTEKLCVGQLLTETAEEREAFRLRKVLGNRRFSEEAKMGGFELWGRRKRVRWLHG